MTFRLHVVFTGGTIGSSASAATTDLVTGADRQLLSYAPRDAGLEASHSEPFRILSEDAGIEEWNVLVRHIATLDLERLDAVVVAHGSDTLAWTGSALSYALAGAPLPIILVGSDRPLDAHGSNGPDNFRDAIAFATTEKLPGVYAAWKNPGEPTTIHMGTRLLPCDIHDDRFRSARGLHFGTVANGEFRRNPVEGNPSRSHLAKSSGSPVWSENLDRARTGAIFSKDVLVLPAVPGIEPVEIAGSHPWKAVVQLAYHSGTAFSVDRPGSLAHLARICREKDVPLVVGPCRSSAAPYASVARLRESGARFAPSMTETSLVAKTRWILGTGQDLSKLDRPVAFDLLGP